MKAWLVFVGCDWEDIKANMAPDWAHRLETYRDWDKARGALMVSVAPFLADTCEVCNSDGQVVMNDLGSLESGQAYWANIDGEDYVLAPVDVSMAPGAIELEEAEWQR
jgi:hypothetical protein